MGAGNSRKGIDGSLGPMCKGILLTFFYLMLAMESKVIDSVIGPRACAWGVVGCCSILPRQLSRPLTVVTTIVPDRSPNPRLKPSFSAHSSSRSLSRGRRRLNTLQRFVNQSFPSKALIRILIPLSIQLCPHDRRPARRPTPTKLRTVNPRMHQSSPMYHKR